MKQRCHRKNVKIKNRKRKMKGYLRKTRRRPEARGLFSRRPNSAKKRDARIVKKAGKL
jgi:hypothetical protein